MGRRHVNKPQELPTPYGIGSTDGSGNKNSLYRRVKARDTGRKLWTKIASYQILQQFRILLALLTPIYLTFSYFELKYTSIKICIFLFILLFLLLIPSFFAIIFAQMSARDRLQLKTTDNKKSINSIPGTERILNTLRERRVLETTRLASTMVSAILLYFITSFQTGAILGSIIVGAAIVLGIFCLLLSISLDSGEIPMRDNLFPLLSLHAPTLHHSALEKVITEILVAHLDPETASYFEEWIKSLEKKVRRHTNPEEAVEYLLRILHLNSLKLLDRDRMFREINRVFKVSATDYLKSDNKFNLESLQILLQHTKSWQPSFFRVIDRLVGDVQRGHSSIIEDKWRMDLEIPPVASEGQTDVIAMVHNFSGRNQTIEIEIISAEGEPTSQIIRLQSPSSKRLKSAVALGIEGEDIVNALTEKLNSCVTLWVGLAWPNTVSGSRPVQINLNLASGETLLSTVLHTSISAGAHAESAGYKMIDAAASVRKLALSFAE